MLALIALLGGLGIAQAEEPSQDLQFDLEGYYRIRGHMFKDLFTVPLSGPQSGRPNQTGKYLTQRLRLQPVVKYEKLAKFTMQADLLDDVVWGDNAMLSTTSPAQMRGMISRLSSSLPKRSSDSPITRVVSTA